MSVVNIDFKIPESWSQLSDKQLRLVYSLLAANMSDVDIKVLCLLNWSNTEVIGRQSSGSYLMKQANVLFETTPLALAELIQLMDWLGQLPKVPVRLQRIKRHNALPANFTGVPFEIFIICDNLYQGYLMTRNEEILEQLGATLYSHSISFSPAERVSIFYWFAALKDFLANRFADFFQPMAGADGNLLGASPKSIEDSMNAQIRALTKGDVTKEKEILAIDTIRALTELNALAREYKELNSKSKN